MKIYNSQIITKFVATVILSFSFLFAGAALYAQQVQDVMAVEQAEQVSKQIEQGKDAKQVKQVKAVREVNVVEQVSEVREVNAVEQVSEVKEVNAVEQVSEVKQVDTKSRREYKRDYSKDTRIAVKLNGLIGVLIVNPAVEFKVMRNFTVQLEGLGSFYTEDCLGTGKPFVLGATFGEMRYYVKRAFDGFYCGACIGWGVYKLNKGLVLRYTEQYNDDSYQQGSNLMVGATIGYQFNINKHWSIEASWSGGFQHSVYEGYRRDKPDEDYKMYVGRNASAEWPPLFKGGIFVAYRF